MDNKIDKAKNYLQQSYSLNKHIKKIFNDSIYDYPLPPYYSSGSLEEAICYYKTCDFLLDSTQGFYPFAKNELKGER